MATISIEIPEDVMGTVNMSIKQWEAEIKKALALQLYNVKVLSFAQAQRVSGITKIEFHYLLGDRKIPRHYDIEDYREDMETLDRYRDLFEQARR